MSAPLICVPGQRLCREEDKLKAGRGTYTRNSFIYSSLAGPLTTTKNENGITLVEVVRNAEENVVPTVDAHVTARRFIIAARRVRPGTMVDLWYARMVTNVNPRFCKCAIIKVGRTALKDSFRGMIRKEDVRATEKDKVEMYKCFRPGDIVIARVISLGDSQSYLLTTAENELGVVIATSEAGSSLVPVSWNKMRCPKTLLEEYRKVAKVQPQFIEYSGT